MGKPRLTNVVPLVRLPRKNEKLSAIANLFAVLVLAWCVVWGWGQWSQRRYSPVGTQEFTSEDLLTQLAQM